MYGRESWNIKNAECQRIDAFEPWCWRRLLRVPWTARRSNQSFLKEISPGCSLKGLMLKLQLQYFGHLMWRTDSFKTLMLGKIEGRRRRGWQSMRWLDGITDSMIWVWMSSGSWWWTGEHSVLQSMGLQSAGHDWTTELNWTDIYIYTHTDTGEGDGNPLQYSCLENPVDRAAWWAAVHRVAQSWAWLKRLNMHACIGEENGNSLQYPCLENPRDRGVWWAAIYRVTESRTRLKWLSSSSIQIHTHTEVRWHNVCYCFKISK